MPVQCVYSRTDTAITKPVEWHRQHVPHSLCMSMAFLCVCKTLRICVAQAHKPLPHNCLILFLNSCTYFMCQYLSISLQSHTLCCWINSQLNRFLHVDVRANLHDHSIWRNKTCCLRWIEHIWLLICAIYIVCGNWYFFRCD